jgi:hypothetical protein
MQLMLASLPTAGQCSLIPEIKSENNTSTHSFMKSVIKYLYRITVNLRLLLQVAICPISRVYRCSTLCMYIQYTSVSGFWIMSWDLIMYHFSCYCVLPSIQSTKSAKRQKKMKCLTSKCFWIGLHFKPLCRNDSQKERKST